VKDLLQGETIMKRVTASLIGLLIVFSPSLAQEPVRERQHVVREGDTLWDLSGFYLNDPFQWPSIYEVNTAVVEDPHWIYPDEVLRIPASPAMAQAAQAMAPAPVEERAVVVMQPAQPPARTVFYRRPPESSAQSQEPTYLSEPDFTDVPVSPSEFNAAPFVANPGDLQVMGRFVRSLRTNRDVGGDPSAHPREQVFLSYAGDQPEVGQSLLLLRVGERMGAFSAQRVLEPTGVVRITELNEEVMQGQLEAQYGPVHKGHIAVPLPMYPDFVVERASEIEGGPDLEGRVIRFLRERPIPTLTDVAFVNLGEGDGVVEGDLFAAYLPERDARARTLGNLASRIERLPPSNVAVLRVIRVTDAAATVKVDALMLPHLEEEIRVRRTHRIQ
jgi:hypothetical protein